MKIRLLVLSCALAAAAFAADVSGKWTAEMPARPGGGGGNGGGRGGQAMTQTITLKADGDALTGSVSGRNGDTPISNGKIDGDTIKFDVVREFNGNSMTMHYTGTISGDQINFKMEREGGEGRAREFTAKRASTT